MRSAGERCALPPVPPSVTGGGRGELRDELISVEALQGEWLDQLRHLAGVDQLRESRADDRRRFEAVGSPSGAEQESIHLGGPEDRAVVRADVAEARPAPKHPGMFELGEELERVARCLLEEVEGSLLAVGRP